MEYFQRQNEVFNFDFFSPFLRIVKTEFAGVDLTACRITYRAVLEGIVPESRGRIGISIEVVEE